MRTWPCVILLLAACSPAISEGGDEPQTATSDPTTGETETTDTEDPPGPSTGDATGNADTSSGGATTSTVVDLGPCANILGCLAEQGETNLDLLDRYGEGGTCWDEFPEPTCWNQCAAWLEGIAPDCENTFPACCSCANSDECIWDPTAPICDGGHCSAGDGPPPPPGCDTISFAADVQPILDDNCVECHAPGGPWPSLDMTVDAYDDLVDADGIQTMALADFRLVVPGEPEVSYILYKLEGTQAEVAGAAAGTQMPQGMEPLDPALRDTVRTWIECGAPP